MPAFSDSAVTAAPPEAVWKLLYDPSRFPEWWQDVERIEPDGDGRGFTLYPQGYPDFPMPQRLETSRDDGTVKISCLVSDLRFEWRLEEADGGTLIAVDVDIPEREAHRLEGQRDAVSRALSNLAELASAR